MNAVHGSDSHDTAARELAFFFPDFSAPKKEGPAKLQRTLALIRPDAYKESKGKILILVIWILMNQNCLLCKCMKILL